jgi:hypothetical protein
MRKLIAVMLVLAMAPAAAQAGTVTLNMVNGLFFKADGTTGLPENSTLVLLADADRDGFGDMTAAVNTWTADPDDILLQRWGSNDFAAGPGSSFDSVIFDYTGLAAGDPMLLLWYCLPYDAMDDDGPGQEVDFGMFRSDDVLSASKIGWNVPAEGDTTDLNFATTSLGGDIPDPAGVAQYTTAPEPATMLMLLAGGAMMSRYARRRRARSA